MASVDVNSNNTIITVTETGKEIVSVNTPGPQGPAGADGAQGIPGPSGSDGTDISALNTFTGSAQAEIDSLTAATGSYLTSLPSNILSSSAQISTDISGAFTAASSSFSTRTTTLESNPVFSAVGISGSFNAASSSFSTRTTTLEANPVFSAAGISGSFTSTSSSFSTRIAANETITSKTLLSSSAQIASDISGAFASPFTAAGISGSFTSASSSFSTRVTTLEAGGGSGFTAAGISGSLGVNATLIRSLTATNISGSFTQPSASFSTRVTTLEAGGGSGFTAAGISGSWQGQNFISASQVTPNLPSGTLSSSAQIASDISGAFASPFTAAGISGSFNAASSSFSTRTTALEANPVFTAAGISGSFNAVSSSFSTRVTTNEANITSITSSLDANRVVFTTTGGQLATDAGMTYDSTNDRLTVQSLDVVHLTSSFITASTIQTSGSNIFGDATNDVQTLIGTTKMTGSAEVTGSFKIIGQGTTSATTSFLVENSSGHDILKVTNDGDFTISTAAKLSANFSGLYNAIYYKNSGGTTIGAFGIHSANSGLFDLRNTGNNRVRISADSGIVVDLASGGNWDSSANLTLNSTTQGFLPPRMTSTQRDAISSPATGLVVYSTTPNKLSVYNGSNWENTNSGSFSGSFTGDGSNLTGVSAFPFTGDAQITGSLDVSGSITTFDINMSTWTLGADGGSNYYYFTGPGDLNGTEQNPDIHLTRGQKYRFYNPMNAHPFQIQDLGGSAFNTGVTNNGVSLGFLSFDVPMDGPTHLKYQCTAHAAMIGNIYISDARIASGSFSGSFQGDGSNLTGISTDPFPFTGDAQITGSLLISGSKIHLRGQSAIPGPILELESIGGGSGKDVYVKVGDASENYAYAFGADDSGNTFRISSGTYSGVTLGTNDKFIIDGNNIEFPAGNISGSATSTSSFGTYLGDGSQLTGIVASTATTASYVETSEYTTRWNVTNNGFSAYRFDGNGVGASDDNPTLYLTRGEKYLFNINALGHPFEIRVANGGSAYSDGVQNNAAETGDVIFEVQMDAPTSLVYQCTNHAAMVGNIYIADARVASGSFSGSFQGDGSALTNLPASNPFPFTGDAQITGSLIVSGSFASFRVDTDNVILGTSAGANIVNGAENNVIIGTEAASNGTITTTADDNVIMGWRAGYGLTNGKQNIIIGKEAGYLVAGSDYNVFVGNNAGEQTEGQGNIGIGYYAGRGKTGGGATGDINVSIGFSAGYSLGNSDYNILIGREAGYLVGEGSNNIMMGFRAGYNTNGSSAHNNTFLGYSAGYDVTTGDHNILIGSGSVGEAAISNQLRIGHADLHIISGSLETGEVIVRSQRPISTIATNPFTASSANVGEYFRAGGNITCSIFATSAVYCPVGAEFDFFQTSSVGNLLFETGSGVTLNSKNGNLNLAGQFSSATLKHVGNDEWDLMGDLT